MGGLASANSGRTTKSAGAPSRNLGLRPSTATACRICGGVIDAHARTPARSTKQAVGTFLNLRKNLSYNSTCLENLIQVPGSCPLLCSLFVLFMLSTEGAKSCEQANNYAPLEPREPSAAERQLVYFTRSPM